MNGKLVELIMRLRNQLTLSSTVYTISDWLHATFAAFLFEIVHSIKRMMVRSCENRRPIRYEVKTVSCKQKANPM